MPPGSPELFPSAPAPPDARCDWLWQRAGNRRLAVTTIRGTWARWGGRPQAGRAEAEQRLIARGGQLAALRAGTLRYARPDATRTLSLPVAGGPAEVTLAEGDVLVLTTETQNADPVLADWAWRPARSPDGSWQPAAAVIPVITVITVQNGLDAERAALRRFTTVFGGVLLVAAGYVTAGGSRGDRPARSTRGTQRHRA